ncbi:MAG: hypothetical protein WCF67_01810 [Chitinophagaceae bacterium]
MRILYGIGVFLLTLFAVTPTFAQTLTADPSFGLGGYATLNFPTQQLNVSSTACLVPLPNKQIIAGCFASIVEGSGTIATRAHYKIYRLNENGINDASFGINGFTSLDLGPRSSVGLENTGRRLALQADGKIVGTVNKFNDQLQAAGLMVFRLNSNGSVDSSFGTNGIVQIQAGFTSSGRCIIIQPDGKIVAAGYGHEGSLKAYLVVRLLPNGTPDNSFNGNGIKLFRLTNDWGANALIQQPDGKLLIGGANMLGANHDMMVYRLTANGSFDNSFNGTGWKSVEFGSASTDIVYDLALQTDNKILVAGHASPNPDVITWGIARLNANGTLDNSFDGDGKNTIEFGTPSTPAYSMAIQNNGKIVIAGGTETSPGNPANTDIALGRLNANGTLDSSFNGTGRKVFNAVNSVDFATNLVILQNGKLLLGGTRGLIPTVMQTNSVALYGTDCAPVSVQVNQCYCLITLI